MADCDGSKITIIATAMKTIKCIDVGDDDNSIVKASDGQILMVMLIIMMLMMMMMMMMMMTITVMIIMVMVVIMLLLLLMMMTMVVVMMMMKIMIIIILIMMIIILMLLLLLLLLMVMMRTDILGGDSVEDNAKNAILSFVISVGDIENRRKDKTTECHEMQNTKGVFKTVKCMSMPALRVHGVSSMTWNFKCFVLSLSHLTYSLKSEK